LPKRKQERKGHPRGIACSASGKAKNSKLIRLKRIQTVEFFTLSPIPRYSDNSPNGF
jgi:hypothetical protein